MNKQTAVANGASIPTFDEVWENWEHFVESAYGGSALGLEGDYIPEDIAEDIFDLQGLPPEVQADLRIEITEVSPEVLAQIKEQYPEWFPKGQFYWSDPGRSHDLDSGF